MKKLFRLTIAKKVFLLTAALSLALILVSVLIASSIFSVRTGNDARALCATSAELLSEYIGTYEILSAANGSTTGFIDYYIGRIDEIYAENRDEIEKMSDDELPDAISFADRKTYFNRLFSPVFASGGGFGMSYITLSFINAYNEIIEEMERMASVEGMLFCEVFYYDAEHNNLVSLLDSSPESYPGHSFPGSVRKAPAYFTDSVLKTNGVTVVSEQDEFASAAPVEVGGKTVAYVSFDYSVDRLFETQRDFLWTLVGIMLAATVVILVICQILANRWLVKNVKNLSHAARAFTSHMEDGELLPVSAGIGTNDEIMELSDDFDALQNKVIAYADDIARKRASEERMQAELSIASKIQMQSLPDKPLITDELRISSFIKPAKEVGGDLFDYFPTDDGKLFFVIADVSGKGVPAALFMMRGKEIIRSCAKAGMSAGKIAERTNRELYQNNKEGLFITAFIGVCDAKEKTLSFVRAGHEQPFLLRGGRAEKFGEESNYVLGAYDGVPFVEDSIELEEGDRILFYTDGLNEGINEENEEFGYDRIKDVLESAGSDLLAALYESACAFAGGAEQFDDITMLLFECVRSRSFTLEKPCYGDIPVVTDRIYEFLGECDKDKRAELGVILDEMMNNYVSYAFRDVRKPRLDIEVRLDGGIAALTFTDNGMLFDPLSKEDPDLDAAPTERPEGGMGIMIVKSMADGISYRVFEGKNRLTILKDLNGGPAA